MIRAGLVLEGYEFIKRIGHGGFSNVWQVSSLKYNKEFVAKVAIVRHHDLETAWLAFDREVQALLRVDHPNVIRLYAHFRYFDNFVMILEFCPNGSLEEYVKKNGRLTGLMFIQTIRDICSALHCAWSWGVRHRDIKPANIMFDENGRAKLVDFGISLTNKGEEDGEEVNDFTCSLVCAAPEIVMKKPYDPIKADVWAMGITILWMAHGGIPWHWQNKGKLVSMIVHGQYIVDSRIDPEIECLARKMLEMEPCARTFPTTEEIMKLGGGSCIAKARVRIRRDISGSTTCRNLGRRTMGAYVLPLHISQSKKRLSHGDVIVRKPNRVVISLLEVVQPSMRHSWIGKHGACAQTPLGPLSDANDQQDEVIEEGSHDGVAPLE